MTVYVESNFVLEIALGQEQSVVAETILSRALGGGITLAVPSCALVEPFSTITRRGDRRRELRNRLKSETLDLKRSWPHEEDALGLESMAELFTAIEDREKTRLDETVQRLFEIAEVIEVDASLYDEAQTLARDFSFTKMTDAIVCASILRHLSESAQPGPHYFATRDAADFGAIDMVQQFRQLGCTVIFTFEECAQRLQISR